MKSIVVRGKQYGAILLGTTLMACAVNLIYEPLGMVTGGISGAAILIKHLTEGTGTGWLAKGVPIGLTNIVLNIPIFIAALRCKGKQFLIRTFLANLWFSLMLFLIPIYPVETKDYLLAAIVGGVLTGAGLGMVLATGTSTGGTDLLAVVLNHRWKYISIAWILWAIDTAIVAAGAAFFGLHVAVYAVVAVYIASKVMDTIAEGLKFAKLAYVISDSYREISKEVMEVLGRGNTILDGRGMYRNEERKLLLCVMGKKQIGPFLSIIAHHDKRAFVIITDAKEVLGEGFLEWDG